MLNAIRENLAEGLRAASGVEIEPDKIELLVPEKPEFGDLYTNLALVMSNAAGKDPRELAGDLAHHLRKLGEVEKAEAAGAGFVNIRLTDEYMHGVVQFIFAEGDDYGGSVTGRGRRFNLEFVSANPTGPLNAVNARAAAYGDSLARILRSSGYEVDTEFYVCDEGTQIALFGQSVQARMAELSGRGAALPPDGYQGEYVRDLAAALLAEKGKEFVDAPLEDITRAAVAAMVAEARAVLGEFNTEFTCWFEQSSLYPEAVEAALTHLRALGRTYEKDDAVWAQTSHFGDGEDRVLVRRGGEPTYFLADLAYHADKRQRGYERVIDVLGPDHHGHQQKMQAGIAMLDYPEYWLEVILCQQVNLMSGGEKRKMSKRAGALVPMRELLAEIGVDVARFFFLMRGYRAHLDFDLDLAKQESLQNPVYYIQYCHARACSLQREAEERSGWVIGEVEVDLSYLTSEQERLLERALWQFPLAVEMAAAQREPHHVCNYLTGLAGYFHRWYQTHSVLRADDAETGKARLALAAACARVIRNGLYLLGIDAPEAM